MSSPSPDSNENTLRATAARWAVRRDRGLSAAESIDYELWLAADPRHAAAMQRTSAAWSLLDRRLPLHRATPPKCALVNGFVLPPTQTGGVVAWLSPHRCRFHL